MQSARALLVPAPWGLPARQEDGCDQTQSLQGPTRSGEEGCLGHPGANWLGIRSSWTWLAGAPLPGFTKYRNQTWNWTGTQTQWRLELGEAWPVELLWPLTCTPMPVTNYLPPPPANSLVHQDGLWWVVTGSLFGISRNLFIFLQKTLSCQVFNK